MDVRIHAGGVIQMNRIRVAALAAATALALTGAAMAHVTLETAEAPAGSYYKAVMRVGHGCEGSPCARCGSRCRTVWSA
jgi:uncharacterized protein YcnI